MGVPNRLQDLVWHVSIQARLRQGVPSFGGAQAQGPMGDEETQLRSQSDGKIKASHTQCIRRVLQRRRRESEDLQIKYEGVE